MKVLGENLKIPVRTVAKIVFAAALVTALFFELGCGDTYRPIADPIFQPGGDPQNSSTVAVLHTNGTAPGSVMTINVSGDTTMNVTAVGSAPGFSAYSTTQIEFYIPNTSADTITSGNAVNGSHFLSLLPGSHPVAITSGLGFMYSFNTGRNSDCPSTGSIGFINTTSDTLETDLCVGSSPTWGLQAGGKLFVLDPVDNTVTIINPSTKQITTTISLGGGASPTWATPSLDLTMLYVVNSGTGTISVVDIANETLLTSLSSGGTNPVFAIEDRVANRLYVANQGSSTVTVFDTSLSPSPNFLKSVPVAGAPNTIATTDGSRVYVGNTSTNVVTEISASSYVTKSISVGAASGATVTWVNSSRDGSKVYAATVTPGDTANGVTVISTSKDSVVTTLKSPQQDPSCSSATSTCLLQRPIQIFGGKL